jgi:hypothetical protein
MVEHGEKRGFYLLINHLKQGLALKVDVTALNGLLGCFHDLFLIVFFSSPFFFHLFARYDTYRKNIHT